MGFLEGFGEFSTETIGMITMVATYLAAAGIDEKTLRASYVRLYTIWSQYASCFVVSLSTCNV